VPQQLARLILRAASSSDYPIGLSDYLAIDHPHIGLSIIGPSVHRHIDHLLIGSAER
jgi:hypothetical protein